MAGLILWNKLGNAYEVEHSEVGPNGTVVNTPTWEDAKFGKGTAVLGGTDTGRLTFGGYTHGVKGCIEMWYKPNYDWDEDIPNNTGYLDNSL